MLGDWLQRANAQLAPAVTTRTVHSYMLGQAGTPPPANGRDSSYWETALPNEALEAMLGMPEFTPFDVLIADEAQDILRNEYLDVLDYALAGGLAAGNWRFFGDFERQSLYGSASLSIEDFCTTRGGHPSRFHLGNNCRNTPRIVQLITTLARMESGYTKILRPDTGTEPRLKFYASRDDAPALLAETLKSLWDDRFRGQDIVILSPRAAGSAAQRVDAPPWSDRVAPAREAGAGQIPYATIHAFKGLEAAAVVLTDIEAVDGPEMESLFYVGITRATDRLVVLMNDAVRPSLSKLLAHIPAKESEPVG
jgi:superfamily I DNA/RNA helicase